MRNVTGITPVVFLALCYCCSVTQSYPTLCNPHGLQHSRLPCPSLSSQSLLTHVHWVSDAIQSSHPLSPASPLALNHSQHQGLFQRVSPSHQVAKVLDLQHLPDIQGWIPLGLTGWISLQSKGLSRAFSNSKAANLWCSTFFTALLSHPYMTSGKTIALTIWTFVSKVMSLLLICCLGLL